MSAAERHLGKLPLRKSQKATLRRRRFEVNRLYRKHWKGGHPLLRHGEIEHYELLGAQPRGPRNR